MKIGSKCIFADTIQDLRKKVEGGYLSGDVGAEDYWCRLVELYDDDCVNRFVPDSDVAYLYAYLIEPPAEPKHKPFESVEKAMEVIMKHGGWVKDGGTGCTFLVLGYGEHKEDFSIYIGSEWVPLEDLFMDFIFADDGTPCGELVE